MCETPEAYRGVVFGMIRTSRLSRFLNASQVQGVLCHQLARWRAAPFTWICQLGLCSERLQRYCQCRRLLFLLMMFRSCVCSGSLWGRDLGRSAGGGR